MQFGQLKRREVIMLLGGAAATWPRMALAQQMPVIGYLSSGSQQGFATRLAAFRGELGETGYREDQNVTIEYRWAEGKDDRLPAMAAELVHQRCTLMSSSTG